MAGNTSQSEREKGPRAGRPDRLEPRSRGIGFPEESLLTDDQDPVSQATSPGSEDPGLGLVMYGPN